MSAGLIVICQGSPATPGTWHTDDCPAWCEARPSGATRPAPTTALGANTIAAADLVKQPHRTRARHFTELRPTLKQARSSAWDEAANEAYDRGLLHDHARDELIARNPYTPPSNHTPPRQGTRHE